jgi:DNA repair photolyase
MNQSSMFDDFEEKVSPKITKLGLTIIDYKEASGILHKPKGFLAAYDYVINPYSGCSFGCSYCYAAAFSPVEMQDKTWGEWVQVKENALSLLRKSQKPLRDKTIYISSVTDPYQPIEKSTEITREILKELIKYQPRIVIQTRSPLVTRDIDLFSQFNHIQVNMTITTDSEEIRKVFEPSCPSNRQRLDAIEQVQQNNISSCITMTPLLPVNNTENFAQSLLETGVKKFVVQSFHTGEGFYVAGTREKALPLIAQYNWEAEGYIKVRDKLQTLLPNLMEGRDGFAPI